MYVNFTLIPHLIIYTRAHEINKVGNRYDLISAVAEQSEQIEEEVDKIKIKR